MSTTLVGLLVVLPVLQSGAAAQAAGSSDAGRTAWAGVACRNCHGADGEGGYGPDLAGRGLNVQQFRRAVRQPWGVMPAYTAEQVSDQQLADMAAFFASLPQVAEPSAPRWTAAPGATPAQRLTMHTAGCANCHQAEMRDPRAVLGGEAADVNFARFAQYVYEHTSIYPDGRMGNFSRDRVPEPVLMEIFKFMKDDLGLRVPITAALSAGAPAGSNAAYTLTVRNRGVKDKGLSAQGVTVTVVVPEGTKVVNATGAGYQGIRPTTVTLMQGQQRAGEARVDAAIWQIPSIEAEATLTYTLTLSGTVSTPLATAFRGSAVAWENPPGRKVGAPDFPQKDARIPDKGDAVQVTFPPAQAQRAAPGGNQ